MKNDRYLRVVLTIIAICLVWICIRDIAISPSYLFASDNPNPNGVWVDGGELDVRIVGTSSTAFYIAEPISVTIDSPKPSEKVQFGRGTLNR